MNLLPEPALPLPKPNTKTYGGNAAFHNFNNEYSHIVNPNLRRRLALSEIDKVCKTLELDLKPCYSMESCSIRDYASISQSFRCGFHPYCSRMH